MPVVRTDSRAVGRSVYSHVITKFSRMGSLYTTVSYPQCSAARASRATAPLLYFTFLSTFSSVELVEPHINAFKVRLAGSVKRRR